MATADRLNLKGMRFYTRVGVLPLERQNAQPLELDLSVLLEPKELEKARPHGFLDYRELYALVASTVGEQHHGLLEELCEAIAARVLALPRVRGVSVWARKPHAPLGGPADYAEVAIERER